MADTQEKLVSHNRDHHSPSVKERHERMFQLLRDRIYFLDYAPGCVLSEVELAQEFEISRTPLRRVLSRLEAEGLVQSVHGVGTIVTDVDIEALQQVYQLRMELAELLGRLCLVPRAPEDLDRIRALIRQCNDAMQAPDQVTFLRLNMQFFQEVTALTGNQPLREVSERLYFQVSRVVLKMMPQLGLLDEFTAFHREMTDILAAAEIGDWQAIGLIRRAHISMSFMRMMRHRAKADDAVNGESAQDS